MLVENEYLALFTKIKNEKIIGEASPSYLADKQTATLIHEVSPDAKILISLRDPVERTFSHYLMQVRDGLTRLTFKESIQKFENGYTDKEIFVPLNDGVYTEDVKRYLNVFGEKNVKIIIFEEFVRNPIQTIQNILKFLGINYENLNFEPEQHNPYFVDRGKFSQKIRLSRTLEKITKKRIPRSTRNYIRNKFFVKKAIKPIMNYEERELLVKFYREDVEDLKTLLNRSLPWKNFKNSQH